MMTRRKLIALYGLIGSILLFGLFVFYVFWMPNTYHEPKGKVVTISRGMTFSAVVDSMVINGVIRSKWAFKLAGKIYGNTKAIRIGKYLFASGVSNVDILYDITEGKSRLIIPVTIPEGWRVDQIARRFKREVGIDGARFISLCRDSQFIRKHNIQAESLEGYLLPDTYAFYWQTDEEEIIDGILESFHRFYDDSLILRQQELHMSQLQILALASIVEAESSLESERVIISGVYWNRLKKRMRLEADPTVQYALGQEKRLNFHDLQFQSPYNTYKHQGLPPGPINNPGRASIRAVLFPAQNEFLYFVANGVGGHRFAKTFSDHQRNIKTYHRIRREMQRVAQREQLHKN